MRTASHLTSAGGVRHDGGVARCGEEVRDALLRQWEAIAAAVTAVDLEIPSRVRGWRNREVVAHLCLQPVLLRRFAATASRRDAVVGVAGNLAGTHALSALIDASAREAAQAGRVDFAAAVDGAVPLLRAADLSAAIVTMQGPIRLVDYLITRCVEAVVHGSTSSIRSTRITSRRPSRPGRCWRCSLSGLPTWSERPDSSRCPSGSMSRLDDGRGPGAWRQQSR